MPKKNPKPLPDRSLRRRIARRASLSLETPMFVSSVRRGRPHPRGRMNQAMHPAKSFERSALDLASTSVSHRSGSPATYPTLHIHSSPTVAGQGVFDLARDRTCRTTDYQGDRMKHICGLLLALCGAIPSPAASTPLLPLNQLNVAEIENIERFLPATDTARDSNPLIDNKPLAPATSIGIFSFAESLQSNHGTEAANEFVSPTWGQAALIALWTVMSCLLLWLSQQVLADLGGLIVNRLISQNGRISLLLFASWLISAAAALSAVAGCLLLILVEFTTPSMSLFNLSGTLPAVVIIGVYVRAALLAILHPMSRVYRL